MKTLKHNAHLFLSWCAQKVLAKETPKLDLHFNCRAEELIPLSCDEQDEMSSLLYNGHLTNNIVDNTTSLDGFLTCLVVGPKSITPDEWLYGLFNGQVPALNGAQTARLLALIERHHHGIEQGFKRAKPYFRPLFFEFTRAKNAKLVGLKLRTIHYWCEGFMAATYLRQWHWRKLLDRNDAYSLLYMPWLLGTDEGNNWKMQRALEHYQSEGFEGKDASNMVSRWLMLPGTHLGNVSELKKSVFSMYEYWK